jgi:hypothetical protein
MPTTITVNKKLTVLALLDIEDAEFAHKYGLGVWWAMYGDEQGNGPYEDIYLTDNISLGLQAGRYNSLSSPWFSHIGFYLGMLHGGYLVHPSDTLVVLTDPDFTKGYYVGRDYYFTEAPLEGRHLTDRLFIEAINSLALDYHAYHDSEGVIRYSLGCRIGELSGTLVPLSVDDIAFDGTAISGKVVRM